MSFEYRDFLNVFFKEKANILSWHRKHDHRIKFEKDHELNHEYVSLYNLSKKWTFMNQGIFEKISE